MLYILLEGSISFLHCLVTSPLQCPSLPGSPPYTPPRLPAEGCLDNSASSISFSIAPSCTSRHRQPSLVQHVVHRVPCSPSGPKLPLEPLPCHMKPLSDSCHLHWVFTSARPSVVASLPPSLVPSLALCYPPLAPRAPCRLWPSTARWKGSVAPFRAVSGSLVASLAAPSHAV